MMEWPEESRQVTIDRGAHGNHSFEMEGTELEGSFVRYAV
jgi:hypothetical protein